MNHPLNSLRPYLPAYILIGLYVAVGALLRAMLWWRFGIASEVYATELLWILPAGVVNDVVQAGYLSLPLMLYLWILPHRWQQSRAGGVLLLIGSVATIAMMLFIATAEYFFFEEFDARFNLVAFDYLMYPTEVIGDIRAEYPAGAALLAALAVAICIVWSLRRCWSIQELRRTPAWPAVLQLAFVAVAIAFIGTDTLGFSRNRVANELVANGASSFFRAARTSEIDYAAFYATRDPQTNFALVADFLKHEGGKLQAERLTRHFAGNLHGLGKLNVVVVVEEAFGAEFSALYGGQQSLTPNFDAYAQQGIWFRHMYASGTRTVRGLEAIAASFPPIPSVSILRRPKNEHIANWGSTMQQAGYQSSFIYGGYGYFDNMNYFFANNGFDVVDRTAIGKVRFANIWGVSDEDLFDRALTYYDERSRSDQPFFSLIMTTSNHKPFTFREGVPGVAASGGGRASGVRYADFSLGYFLAEAKKHAWFDNTLFVVVADHGARVYGKADIPLRSYEIPMMFYAPKHVQPAQVETLTGQIDIAPTVLGLLGFEYSAPFFGADVLACGAKKSPTACSADRLAFFNHNYDVATYRDGKLAVLSLGKKSQMLAYDRASDSYTALAPDSKQTNLAIAIYQTAYEQFQAHRYQ